MILKFLFSKETFLKGAEFPSKTRSLIFHKKCMFLTISHSKCFNYQYMSRENFPFRSIHDFDVSQIENQNVHNIIILGGCKYLLDGTNHLPNRM